MKTLFAATIIKCAFDTGSVPFSVEIDSDDNFRMSGPHQLWKAKASVYSNPEGETYFVSFGKQEAVFKLPASEISLDGGLSFEKCK